MGDSGIKTLHVHIFGKVQGVFFRDFTRRKAEELHLFGWARNCADGSVESLISGDEAQVAKMVEWFHQGSPYSSVQKVVTEDYGGPPSLKSFLIKY
jgi:acylphosphatase